jgi:hypothetical protein
MSTPRDFHENGCWNIRCPRSPAKKSAFGLSLPSAAKNRRCATLISWASSTTAWSKITACLFVIILAKALNRSASVTRFLFRSSFRTISKIDQRVWRCASGSLVLRPSRATSRYSSQVSSCQASTTCSHVSNQSDNVCSCSIAAFSRAMYSTRINLAILSIGVPRMMCKASHLGAIWRFVNFRSCGLAISWPGARR